MNFESNDRLLKFVAVLKRRVAISIYVLNNTMYIYIYINENVCIYKCLSLYFIFLFSLNLSIIVVNPCSYILSEIGCIDTWTLQETPTRIDSHVSTMKSRSHRYVCVYNIHTQSLIGILVGESL